MAIIRSLELALSGEFGQADAAELPLKLQILGSAIAGKPDFRSGHVTSLRVQFQARGQEKLASRSRADAPADFGLAHRASACGRAQPHVEQGGKHVLIHGA